MDRETLQKQMKTLKGKAKAARKAGKRELVTAFKRGSARAKRKLKALNPRKKVRGKKGEEAAAAPAPAAAAPAATPAV